MLFFSSPDRKKTSITSSLYIAIPNFTHDFSLLISFSNSFSYHFPWLNPFSFLYKFFFLSFLLSFFNFLRSNFFLLTISLSLPNSFLNQFSLSSIIIYINQSINFFFLFSFNPLPPLHKFVNESSFLKRLPMEPNFKSRNSF